MTRGIWTTGNNLEEGAGAGAAANLDDRRNCVKGVGAGEWGTSRFMPNCVASGSGSSTKWAPKSMALLVGAALLTTEAARSGASGATARGCGRAGALEGCPAARSRRSLAVPLGVGSGCCGRRPAGIGSDDSGGLATPPRDSDGTKMDDALRAGRPLGATERHELLACIDAIRLPEAVNDPHAVRRLRHRAWAILRQEMRPLQHTLLRGSLPETTLGRGRP